MDPQAVLQRIEQVRAFVEEYGGALFRYAERAVELIVYAITHLPAWIAGAWAYLTTLIDAIRAFYD